MYDIIFYKDRHGNEPVKDFIIKLSSKNDKDSRINTNKILEYIDYLRKHGHNARKPYAKRLDGDIWELRPIDNRILYATWEGNKFILLHHFRKETQKTPPREIKQALLLRNPRVRDAKICMTKKTR